MNRTGWAFVASPTVKRKPGRRQKQSQKRVPAPEWDGTWPSKFCRRAVARRRSQGERMRKTRPPSFDYGEAIAIWMRTGARTRDVAAEVGADPNLVRRVLAECSFPWERALVARRKEARARLRRWVDTGRHCRTCGRGFIPGECDGSTCAGYAYCSKRCYAVWLAFRFRLDPELDRRHRILVARRRYEMSSMPEHREHWEAQIANTVKSQGRWFVRGSKPLDYAIEAYQEGWPIFDRLPEPCRRQVVDLVEGFAP